MAIGNKKKYCFVVLTCLGIVLNVCLVGRLVAQTPSTMRVRLLTPMAVKETQAYRTYGVKEKNEGGTIQYLINLVQSSRLKFLRNNHIVSGMTAGVWMRYKLQLYSEDATTVEDFITKVASYSRKSGEAYYVIYEDTAKVSMKEVLFNELQRIREYEKSITTGVLSAER
ncbi:MAG: DUF5329 family protein [Candidatus Omnitrophica bacterium]|nr:DUF5329 family protein [Candidatus Omnitrophota bacterium]